MEKKNVRLVQLWFEPVIPQPGVKFSTTELNPQEYSSHIPFFLVNSFWEQGKKWWLIQLWKSMENVKYGTPGFEPGTSWPAVERSSIELYPQKSPNGIRYCQFLLVFFSELEKKNLRLVQLWNLMENVKERTILVRTVKKCSKTELYPHELSYLAPCVFVFFLELGE